MWSKTITLCSHTHITHFMLYLLDGQGETNKLWCTCIYSCQLGHCEWGCAHWLPSWTQIRGWWWDQLQVINFQEGCHSPDTFHSQNIAGLTHSSIPGFLLFVNVTVCPQWDQSTFFFGQSELVSRVTGHRQPGKWKRNLTKNSPINKLITKPKCCTQTITHQTVITLQQLAVHLLPQSYM